MYYTDREVMVLDFDGVLVESNVMKKEMFFEIWEHTIDPCIVNDALQEGGDRFLIISKICNRVYRDKKTIPDKYNYYLSKYTESVRNKIIDNGLKDGVIDFLLHNKKKLFINSSTPDVPLNEVCDDLDIRKYFQEILGATRSKKNNFIYIMSKYGVSSNEISFVGDMMSDKLVANDLGVEFISVFSDGTDLNVMESLV